METQKMEYLKLIQDVITRMANNSFALKGWAITLVVGLFGISVVNNAGIGFYCIIYIPIITFWFLDTYYLRQERLFRGLYNRVRKMDESALKEAQYTMVPPLKRDDDFKHKDYNFIRVLISKTEAGLYVPLLGVLTLVILILSIQGYGASASTMQAEESVSSQKISTEIIETFGLNTEDIVQ